MDHVHPSFRGHEDIAISISEWMLSVGIASETNTTWKEDAAQEFRDRLLALDGLYFLRGRRALRSLRLWAAGRADETPLSPPEESVERQTSQDNWIPSESIESVAK